MTHASSDQKLRELILYIVAKHDGDETFGSVKLNKILFFSDFIAFHEWRKAITGVDYQKLKHGPAPKRMLPVLNDMHADLLKRERPLRHGLMKHEFVALRDPDLSVFSAEEIALVDNVIDAFRGTTASYVSRISHVFNGWKAANLNEIIPYETTFLGERDPTPEEKAYALELGAAVDEIHGR